MDKMDNKNNHLQKNSSKELQTFASSTVSLYNTTLKVRDFADDNKPFWSKTRMTLSKCSLMLGSKTAPTDEEYFLLKETLIKSFKDFSPEEIEDAFDKLVGGKLGLEVDKYGKVTVAYLGQILIAHREYRNKALAKELKDRPKEEVVATDEVKEKARAEFLENCLFKPYREIKEKGKFDVDRHIASQLFRIFRRARLIDVPPDEDEKYFQLGLQDLKNAAQKDHTAHKPMLKVVEGIRAMNKGENENITVKAIDRAQGLYFVDYITNLHKNNRDIKIIAEKL